MNKLLKIDNIMYFVRDLNKSAKFYEDILGMKRRWTDKERGMIGFTFQDSDSELALYNDLKIPNYNFSFLVKNVDNFCKEFKENGYRIKTKPIGVRCGKYAIPLDPNDNIIPIIDLTKFGSKPKYD